MIFCKNYKTELKDFVLENKELFTLLKNQSILITGAAGLIASYMIDLVITANETLSTNCKVYAVDLDAQRLEKCFPSEYDETVTRIALDVNETEVDIDSADYVIHAASNTSPLDYALKPVDTMRTNVIGTDNLIRFALKCGAKRFLFCSSVEAYGRNNGDTDEFLEDYSGYVDCNTLRAGYPSAKRASEALCNAYMSQCENFDFVTGRIGRIYGPTVIEGDAKAPSQFINNAVNGENIVMKSDGMQEYSYGYVGDCAVALFFIMLKGGRGEAYNIADPNSKIRLRDFAEFSAKAGGTQVVYEAPTDIEKMGYSKITKATMNVDKLLSLGFISKYPVEEGIKRTVDYIKEMRGR